MANYLVWQCEACGFSVRPRELSQTQRALGRGRRLHLGCLTPAQRARVRIALQGVPCLFCTQGGMTLRQLVDHFSERHGRVL